MESEIDDRIVDELIHGSSKRSSSYHSEYGKKTYREIRELAAAKPPDQKARQMMKLVKETRRLAEKPKTPRGRKSRS